MPFCIFAPDVRYYSQAGYAARNVHNEMPLMPQVCGICEQEYLPIVSNGDVEGSL
jgi:hypothetical protein